MSDAAPVKQVKQGKIELVADAAAMAGIVADRLIELALAGGERVAICLSGGSTPKALYEALAEPARRDRFPWARVHWFWGDERDVPPDHPDSNYRMARLAMLAAAPVPPAHVHRIPVGDLTPEAAARAYEIELKQFYGAAALDPARPLFDAVLLGLGEDGHTASLFPGAPTLDNTSDWVASVPEGFRDEARVTLTYPVLDSARAVLFLIAGKGKQQAWKQLRAKQDIPAARVSPSGDLIYYLDKAAAGES